MKKLKKILLINWLYFSKEIIEVGDINFLTGKNGAGKSTAIDALQIVLLGETNARNFNQAANEKSQRTLDGYLRADMDENNPYSRRGKDFSSYIACEFQDDVVGSSFVTGVVFDCRSDGSRQERFFIYVGTLPENCFVENGEAMEIPALRRFLKQNYAKAEIYDTQKEYRRNMLSRWNVHNEQVLRMMKKAVSFRPIVDIQKFITENICDIPEKPDIEAMQQNIRDYKRHEMLAQRQEEMLNVAVSRAVHSLAVVTSQDPCNDQTNYGDLTRYIEYNNFEVIQSQVYSVFDMLYQGYAEKRRAYLQKHKRVSEYDSENLMYSVIQEVLSEEAFSSIGCAVHVSLATLVKDYEPLTEEERQYARNLLTHVDFLLFNQMDKQPVLAIEVDGTGFHEAGSKQAERDMKKNSVLEKCAVPFLRLRTDGSGEKEKIRTALKGE